MKSLQKTLEEIRDDLASKVKEKKATEEEAKELDQLSMILMVVDSGIESFAEILKTLEIKVPDINVPEIKVPEVVVNVPEVKLPDINVPEVKLPTINVPEAKVTVNVPKKDMEETNKLLKDIIKNVSKNDSVDIEVSLKIV